MVIPTAETVVVVPSPFSDLTASKSRPAVALAHAGGSDWILCQVTSRPYGDRSAILLADRAFASGSLRVASYARPGKLFTASHDLIVGRAGVLKPDAHRQIVESVVTLLRSAVIA